jgi:hypothetical protein
MSHIVQIQTEVRDAVAIVAACRRLELAEPTVGTARLYEGETSGMLVRLNGWTYPVVVDVERGTLKYDNFEGVWGDAKELDRFLQAYAVEKATLEARKRGHSVREWALDDGSIRLEIGVGGGS